MKRIRTRQSQIPGMSAGKKRALQRRQRARTAVAGGRLKSPGSSRPNREGSVIAVVLALTIGLLILAMLLYTDASQEEISAEYFAKSGQVTDPSVDIDRIAFDALRQIIIGANDVEKHSPFYGGRRSLLPTMFGAQRSPFTGQGVNIGRNPTTGALFVDNDFDGAPDPGSQTWWRHLNDSPAVHNGTDRADTTLGSNFSNAPSPAAGYTYPDFNSPFVFYKGTVLRGGVAREVLIPSYIRPQLLRGVATPDEWYSNASTLGLHMRPHMRTRALRRNGTPAVYHSSHPTLAGQPILRYVSTLQTHGIGNFEFPVHPSGGAGTSGPEAGIWEAPARPNAPYRFDRDLDGDGTPESILLDMDLGIFSLPDGSRQFVPIVSAMLMPMDGNFDLNAHGNTSGIVRSGPPANGAGRADPSLITPALTRFIHQSNQSVSRSEINPQWALRLAGNATAMQPYQNYFGRTPINSLETANMEWWWLVTGRPDYTNGGRLPGKYGEEAKMINALANNGILPSKYPRPGVTDDDNNVDSNADGYLDGDDNGNSRQGSAFLVGALPTGSWVYPAQVQFPAYVHPVDERGRGNYVNTTNHTSRLLTYVAQQPYPTYNGYYINPPQWPSGLFSNSANLPLIDEPNEMIQQPFTANTNDGRFTISETISLQMSNIHQLTTNRDQSLLMKLAPQGFSNETIRKFFTTITGDTKTFGKMYNFGTGAYRPWEFSTVGGAEQFPPQIGTITIGTASDPIRPELRELLRIRIGDRTARPLQRKLSVNEVLDYSAAGQLRFRPLTPHVVGSAGGTPLLGRDPVSGHSSILGGGRFNIVRPEQIGTTGSIYHRQEWLARRDRQMMCRDIFMMLYLFGGPNTTNYAQIPNAPTGTTAGGLPIYGTVYTDAQLQEMAQFAVNLVDSRDEDNIPTIFEYDKNPVNGWNVDDDPFTDRNAAGTVIESERGVAIGVERQQLTISEGLMIFAKKVTNSVTSLDEDHPATDFDDRTHHAFAFLQLENVTPVNVRFDNSSWQVVLKDGRTPAQVAAAMTAMNPYVEERRLILNSNAGPVRPPNAGDDRVSRFVIASQNDTSFDANTDGNIDPTRFNVNPKYKDTMGGGDMGIFTRIAPATLLDSEDLDLMASGTLGRYSVVQKPPSTTAAGDGPTVTPHSALSPAGREFLTVRNGDNLTGASNIVVEVLLRRRLHPNRVQPVSYGASATNHDRQSRDNPWITVDTMRVPLSYFALNYPMMSNGTDVRTNLNRVRSRERRQPLDGNTGGSPGSRNFTPVNPAPANEPTPDASGFVPAYRFNRLNDLNQFTRASFVAPFRYTLWQPQLDRPFTSLGELLTVPLYGGTDVRPSTGEAHDYRTTVPQSITLGSVSGAQNIKVALTNLGPTGLSNDPKTAVSRFLRPDMPIVSATMLNLNGNRWYRVLSLLDIPEPNPNERPWYITTLGRWNTPVNPTTSGRLALNSLSHPAQLAGLIDDQNMLSYNTAGPVPRLLDNSSRDWWNEFLRARDGVDPLAGVPLPGVPGVSKPFRDLSDRHDNSAANRHLEHTVLRSLPSDNNTQGRRLFEVGNSNQQSNWQTRPHTEIDLTTRYRLLSKVMNNTTNRSNVFLLILRIEFFEAVEVDADDGSGGIEKVVRIGAKLPGAQSPDITTYYVIDRSRGMMAPHDPTNAPANLGIRQDELPTPAAGRFIWSFRQDMNFRRFVLEEQVVN